jgi:hypothetical protein
VDGKGASQSGDAELEGKARKRKSSPNDFAIDTQTYLLIKLNFRYTSDLSSLSRSMIRKDENLVLWFSLRRL